MGSNPINLAIRFLLELSVLFAMGLWAWKLSEGWVRFALAIGLPLLAMIIWGTFAVPDDPSRSGQALVQVSGVIRLLIEFAFFAIAVWMLKDMGFLKLGLWLGIITVIHYAFSYDRIMWLLAQ